MCQSTFLNSKLNVHINRTSSHFSSVCLFFLRTKLAGRIMEGGGNFHFFVLSLLIKSILFLQLVFIYPCFNRRNWRLFSVSQIMTCSHHWWKRYAEWRLLPRGKNLQISGSVWATWPLPSLRSETLSLRR